VNYLNHDVSPALTALEQPVLVVSGREDRVSSPVMARAIADRLRRGSFAEIRGGSHYCLYENAEETIAVIESFLRGRAAQN
jgi:pimeloyl-ACP methyl ester carboxylesterase